jgi:hypothetical protein
MFIKFRHNLETLIITPNVPFQFISCLANAALTLFIHRSGAVINELQMYDRGLIPD